MSLSKVQLYSTSLSRQVEVVVIMPEDQSSNTCPLLILLHGWHGNQSDWIRYTQIYEYAMEHGICVVMPSGENKFYIDNTSTNDYFSRFISIELVAWARNTYRISDAYEDTIIGGLSMGGYGAVVNALYHSSVFSHCIALSSALIKDDILDEQTKNQNLLNHKQIKTIFDIDTEQDFIGSDKDYDYLLDQVASEEKKPEIYLACGKEDFLFTYNERFVDHMKQLNYPFTHIFDTGEHTWKYWDYHIKKALEWYIKKRA